MNSAYVPFASPNSLERCTTAFVSAPDPFTISSLMHELKYSQHVRSDRSGERLQEYLLLTLPILLQLSRHMRIDTKAPLFTNTVQAALHLLNVVQTYPALPPCNKWVLRRDADGTVAPVQVASAGVGEEVFSSRDRAEFALYRNMPKLGTLRNNRYDTVCTPSGCNINVQRNLI